PVWHGVPLDDLLGALELRHGREALDDPAARGSGRVVADAGHDDHDAAGSRGFASVSHHRFEPGRSPRDTARRALAWRRRGPTAPRPGSALGLEGEVQAHAVAGAA